MLDIDVGNVKGDLNYSTEPFSQQIFKWIIYIDYIVYTIYTKYTTYDEYTAHQVWKEVKNYVN